jgi:cell division protein FtsB
MPSARSAAAARTRQAPRARSRAKKQSVLRGVAKRVRWDRVGRTSLLVMLVVVAGLYVQHTLSYLSTRSQADQQQAIMHQLQRQNAGLSAQQKALSNPVTIEQDARELGMVMPGEHPYSVIGMQH